MSRYVRILGVLVTVLVLSILAAYRPIERIADVHTPDGKHAHQVYAKNPLRMEFLSTAQGLSGVSIDIQRPVSSPIVRLTNITESREVSSSLEITDNTLQLRFKPEAHSYNKKYSVDIELPNAKKQDALFVPYESDSTKYPNTIVWQGDTEKQGSLGMIQYEQPTAIILMFRWLAHPHQRLLWVGVIFVICGILIRRNFSRIPDAFPKKRFIHWKWMLCIWIGIIVLYYPATNLFFYGDDMPILARTVTMWQQSPLLLFTPHQYQESDLRAAFGFDFWRPVSFVIYPLLLHLTIPPSAFLYYFLNIALFAGIGCLLFTIARIIGESKRVSLLAVTIWATSSAKLGVVYWWSSIQDILASLFAMASIVLYFSWRKNAQKRFLSFAVATYLLGVFSKEYVIILPLVIIAMEFLIHTKNTKQFSWKTTSFLISPFIIAAGTFLIVNTAVLGDPTLAPRKATDQTYHLTLSPEKITRNVIIYLSATAEARIWREYQPLQDIEEVFNQKVRLWEAKTSGPYYPGIILALMGIALPILFWKNTSLRYSLLFGMGWWILFMGPILLFAYDWKVRWLTLATFGTGLMLAITIDRIRNIIPHSVGIMYALSAVFVVYGYQNARSPELMRYYKEQSEYTRHAYEELIRQENNEVGKRIILIGITPDQETSLNAYLFRLYAKNPKADIIYSDSPRENTEPGDIIINMTGIVPYYPVSEK